MRGDTVQFDAAPWSSAADGPKDRPHAGRMIESPRIEVARMGSADAERGHGDHGHHRDGRNLKQLVHRGSPVFIQVLTQKGRSSSPPSSGDLLKSIVSPLGLIIRLAEFF